MNETMKLESKTFNEIVVRFDACGNSNTVAIVFCRDGDETVAWLVFKIGLSHTQTRFAGGGTPVLYFPDYMMKTIVNEFRTIGTLTVHYDQSQRIGRLTTSNGPMTFQETMPFLV